jgi:hypothetical protein
VEKTRATQAQGTAGLARASTVRIVQRTLELRERERQRVLDEQQLHPCEPLGLWTP